jgi:hypothetical protein
MFLSESGVAFFQPTHHVGGFFRTGVGAGYTISSRLTGWCGPRRLGTEWYEPKLVERIFAKTSIHNHHSTLRNPAENKLIPHLFG